MLVVSYERFVASGKVWTEGYQRFTDVFDSSTELKEKMKKCNEDGTPMLVTQIWELSDE